ncbi:MAG: response regulator transcription factor [Flavobacteriales bacterium]|nr:response regulator transcription factor [Flavobacteriales bacterium]
MIIWNTYLILEKLLSEIEEVELIQKFTNPTKTKEWLQKNKVDLLISDIEMNHLNGLELINQLEKPPFVIYVSSYPKYAAKSFELEPLHYLVKPINEIDLRIAIERAKNKILKKEVEEYIIIKEGHALFHKISLSDILFIEADNDYVKVICKKKEYRTHCTLKEIENRLGSNFIKTHRSYLVNQSHINKINGTFAEIKNYTIPVSRAYKQTVYDRLGIKN